MARRKETPWVVFGANDYPNKVITYNCESALAMVTVRVFEMDNNDKELKWGDRDKAVSSGRITGEYFRMYFCKKESVKAMRDIMQEIYDRWDEMEAEAKE